jgi:hypothetical protein
VAEESERSRDHHRSEGQRSEKPQQRSGREDRDQDRSEDRSKHRSESHSDRGASRREGRLTGSQAAVLGAQQLVELTGKDFEGIVGFSKDDEGWLVQVEVVELRRVPDSTDVLAIYEVLVDGEGDLAGYRRLERYARGSTAEDGR